MGICGELYFMKSERKKQKIILNKFLINELKKKDDELIMIRAGLDKAHYMINSFNKEMIDLAKFMNMEGDKLTMMDVIKEVKLKLGK